MKKLVLFLLLGAAGALAGEHAAAFRANDVVCYVGDSITHGGTYHSIVTLFYATRFPDRPIRFYNCGISGDRASSIMSDERFRVNVDILGHKPTAATIMLGMNDVGRNDYEPSRTGPEIEKRRQTSLDTYRENMAKLIAALEGVGARLTLITPSIYEEAPEFNPTPAAPALPGVNGALGKCAREVRTFAKEHHAGVADFWGAMNAVDERERKSDKMFTIVGRDRVHPGPVGHFVMAYTFLKAQNLPRDVAQINVDAGRKKPAKALNCTIENIKASNGGVEFDVRESSLPLVVPEEARAALKLVPFVKDFNQEILMVRKLKQGTYELRIDKKVIGEYSDADLKKGINLAENANTPEYQQSEAVTKINADRTRVAQRIRDSASQKYALSRAKFDVFDQEALIKRLSEQLVKGENPRMRVALEDAEQPGRLDRQYEELSDELYMAAQPKPHHFVLTRK